MLLSNMFRQTGSGKTYTMEGIDNDGQRGIISRTITKIFEETNNLVEKVSYACRYIIKCLLWTMVGAIRGKFNVLC